MIQTACFYLIECMDQSDALLSQPEQIACDLAATHWRLGKKVLILCACQQQAERLDEALWQRDTESFVPHNLVGEGPRTGAPVVIAWEQNKVQNYQTRHLLISLVEDWVDFATTFREVIDFVPFDESLKQFARERYKAYRRAGFQLTTAIAPIK